MPVLIITLILVATFLFGVICPTVFSAKGVFARQKTIPFDTFDLEHTQFAPYAAEMRSAADILSALPQTDLSVTADDGTPLVGRLYANGDSDKTVLFVHGYHATPLLNFSLQARRLCELGFNVLFVIQRGHGKSGGKHTTLGLLEQKDVLCWLDALEGRPYARRVLVYGTSMGCASVSLACDRFPDTVKAMVLDCGYTSPRDQILEDCTRRHVPGKLIFPFFRAYTKLTLKVDVCDSVLDPLGRTAVPALFLHGTEDESVSFENGVRNYEGCASEKEKIFVDGAKHTLSYAAADSRQRALFDSFVRKYFD